MRHAITFLLVCLIAFNASAQNIGDTITVKLQRHVGPGPFSQGMSTFKANPTSESQPFFALHEKTSGLPIEYTELSVGSLSSDFRQMAYYAVKNEVLDSAENFNKWFSKESPEELAQLTTDYVDTEVSMAYGKANSEHILIIDKNNNEDFSDDEVISLDIDKYGFEEFQNPPIYSALIERYNKKAIIKDSIYFAFLPLKQMGKVYMSSSEYRSGAFTMNGRQHHIFVNNSFYGIQYTPATLKVLSSNEPYNKEEPKVSKDDQISFNDFIFGDEFDFQIVGIDLEGNHLKLLVSEKKERKGTSVGQIAPDIVGVQLDGTPFKTQLGNTVLLDFWGTWCGPCIGEIPFLQDAYKVFKSEGLEIVSIANDKKQTVEKFLTKNDMPWKHLMESEAGTAKSDFRIRGYPTTFLLDKEMKVAEKQTRLRNVMLIKTLSKHFDLSLEEVQNRLNSGNVVLSFVGKDLVSLNVEAEFIKGTSQFYRISEKSQSLERGFDIELGNYELKIRALRRNTREVMEITHNIKVENRSIPQRIVIDIDEK
ncbi:TlpA disulfide reductase family protein [uncultured Roseivirga sp.]|uniref:TlpA family protein disulfide reductase n=1 Tax=uncultured Roseivirga sp. TaxID=543088 RepID=UPI000D79AF35|nr:TlpA disulfide reductase family protein [uncultured Roseivirga sp.]PWL29838.1 MAG: hypothetical protein DCO95_08330 [Roseivirga sp. XM-24bin3]